MQDIKDYKKIVGEETIKQIKEKAKRLSGKHIVCISSTHQGGGVAEILNSTVFLFNKLGINFGWRILHGNSAFFSITKQFHNALQGGDMKLSEKKKNRYFLTNQRFSVFTHLNHDLVIVHDPQPLALIDFYKKQQPWIFRCHIDMSNPNKEVWGYLKQFIKKYDEIIVSSETYKQNIDKPQNIIYPATDPFSQKNKKLTEKRMEKHLKKYKIKLDKPIIAQISRFDKWKDPEGVLKIFDKVKSKVDCQLVLLGNLATDDPEGIEIYNEIIKKYADRDDIKIILKDDDTLVNTLQRKAAVIIQKSKKEGFGLTVTEALYKGTPVVASNVGGIPLQVINNRTGYLHDPEDYDGFAESVIKLLKDTKLREELGKNGKDHVTKHFLITRLINDWLELFEKYLP